jgi:hypothetical protein
VAEERRKTLRKTFSQPAGLFHPDGKPICGCVMRDISDTGARLRLEAIRESSIDELPSEFILSISKSGNVFRRCRLVWRRNNELGVHFSPETGRLRRPDLVSEP